MRNLYRRLGVSESTSPDGLRRVISTCKNHTLRNDAQAVLLDARRKREYDQLHSLLTQIGTLRARLGLNQSDNWYSPEAEDYWTRSERIQSMHDALAAKVRRAHGTANSDPIDTSFRGAAIRGFRVIGVLVAILLGFWVFVPMPEYADSQKSAPTPPNSASEPRPQFAAPALELPANGATRNHTSRFVEAPFEIRTRGQSNFLVKLEDVATGTPIIDVFIRGGHSTEVQVPFGRYHLKYVSGNNWYGYEHLFGPKTSYNKADSIFNFNAENGRVTGYTVELYEQVGGNLRTSRIDPEDF